MSLTLFHTGVVVNDLAAAMDHHSKLLGLEWASPVEHRRTYRGVDRDHDAHLKVSYSMGAGHHVELIEQKEGSVFRSGDAFRAHHLGFWTDSLEADTASLVANGYRLLFYGFNASGNVYGETFLEPPEGGLLVELLDERRRPDVERWCSGGALGERSF
jgi:hypothetical protein